MEVTKNSCRSENIEPVLMKPKKETVQGKYAVCEYCGKLSLDYDVCDGCHYSLDQPKYFWPAQFQSGQIPLVAKSVWLGSVKITPSEPVTLSAGGLRLKMQIDDASLNIDIKVAEIWRIFARLDYVMPVIFFTITPQCAASIRERCQINTKAGPYTNPKKSFQHRISFMLYEITDDQIGQFCYICQCIEKAHPIPFRLSLLQIMGIGEANDTLVSVSGKTFPYCDSEDEDDSEPDDDKQLCDEKLRNDKEIDAIDDKQPSENEKLCNEKKLCNEEEPVVVKEPEEEEEPKHDKERDDEVSSDEESEVDPSVYLDASDYPPLGVCDEEESCDEVDPSEYLDPSDYMDPKENELYCQAEMYNLFLRSSTAARTRAMTIRAALATNAPRVTISGHVIEAQEKKFVTRKDWTQTYAREFKLSDNEATMIVSLWDGCAQYAEIEVGDHLEVRHARLKDNTFHQQKVAYVDYLNQIVHMKPESSTEDLTIIGVGRSDLPDYVWIRVKKHGQLLERMQVELDCLYTALQITGPFTSIRCFVEYLPIEINATILGNSVTSLKVLKHHSPSPLASSGSIGRGEEAISPAKKKRYQ